jgi:hypothetical protein
MHPRSSERCCKRASIQLASDKDGHTASAIAQSRQGGPIPQVIKILEALEYAARAGDLVNWSDANYFDTLGVAYAEAGDFDVRHRGPEESAGG